jgi:uncharacterized membrane protein YdjX (TVP38/TMEM64 family)
MQLSLKKILIGFLLVSIFLFGRHSSQHCINNILLTLKNYDFFTSLLCFSLLYLLSNLFFIPIGLPLNLLAGILWGTLGGGLLINGLATFVAGISFHISRKYGYHFSERLLMRYPRLLDLSSALAQYDWQIIAMARINPIVPFCASNYIFGLMPGLIFKRYIVTTAITNLLPCLSFAALGVSIQSVTLDNNVPTIIFQVGLALLLLSVLYIVKMISINRQARLSIKKEIEI